MTQLTVRGIDEQLLLALKAQATQRGVSVNRLVLESLRKMTGQTSDCQAPQRFHDLDYLAGTWTEEAYTEFQAALVQQRQIDPELWQSQA
jgi:hypothetical protein